MGTRAFERYTESAKRVVYFARLEALHRNESAISCRDIVVGLTWDADTRVERIAAFKSKAVVWRSAVQIPHLPITPFPYKRSGHLPLDNDAKKVLGYALIEADSAGDYWVDSDHLLRGLLRVQNETSDALVATGITLEKVRSASILDRKLHPPESPLGGRIRLLLFRNFGPVLFIPFLILIYLLFAFIKWMFG